MQYIRRVQPKRFKVSQFIYFCKTLYMFQTCFPSIIRSSKLHIQRQVADRPIPLPAGSPVRLAAGSTIGLTLYMQFWAPDDGRKNHLKHVERLTEINKLWNVASCWLYSANTLAMHGPMNVKFACGTRSSFWQRWSRRRVAILKGSKMITSRCLSVLCFIVFFWIVMQFVPNSKQPFLIFLFSLLHRACCRVTQLLYQLMHIYKIYKIYTLKQ